MELNPYAPPSVPTIDPARTLIVRSEITEEFLLDMHEREMLRHFSWPTVLYALYSLGAIGVAITIVAASIGVIFLIDSQLGKNLAAFGVPIACVVSILCIGVTGRFTKSIWRAHAAKRLQKARERNASYLPGQWTLFLAESELTVQFPNGDSRQYAWRELSGDYSEAIFKGILLKNRAGDLIPVPRAMQCDEPWKSVERIIHSRNWKWWSA